MRVANFLAVVGLASAIPSPADHRHLHRKRDLDPVVKTVTTTWYQTIVWVDSDGNPISTQINTPPAGAAPAFATPTAPASPPANAPENAGAESTPKQQAAAPSHPATRSSNTPQSSATAAPSSAQASNIANPQQNKGAVSAPGGMGICYDMINSQSQCKDSGTINSEFSFLKSQGFGMVRVYDVGCPVGDFAAAAAKNGLRLMAGINQIANLQGDLGKLISSVAGNWGAVDTIYIGNELVNNGAASAGQVAAAVATAKGILKGAGFAGSVITVDTFNTMIADPTICSTSDYCGANTHAFFDPNTAAQNAGNFVLNAYNKLASVNSGKRIVITESGWPWKGSCNGQACPSVDNQKAAMNSIMSSFSGNAGNLFLFQAYNAGYKQAGQNGVEPFFGIYDSDHYAGGIGSA